MGQYRDNEKLFTRTFTNQTISMINDVTGFLQIAIKKVSGTVRFKGNATQIQVTVNGTQTALDSDWVDVADDEDVSIVSIDGILEVTIDGSAGVFKLMAIQ